MKILSFGSCNIDYVYSMPHIITPGETLSSLSMAQYPGGKGFNQAIALGRAGAKAAMAGNIGAEGRFMLDLLREAKVDPSLVRVTAHPTGSAIIQVDSKGQNCIIVFGGANRTLSAQQIDEVMSTLSPGDMVLLQNEVNMLGEIVQSAKSRGLQIALNPSPIDDALKDIDLKMVDVLLINEVEGNALSGKEDAEDIIKVLQTRYQIPCIVLTLGGDGAVCATKQGLIKQAIFPVEAVDTTAAGDTFTGYFLKSFTQTPDDPQTAVLRAAAASALAVSKKGAAVSIPWSDEVDAFLESHKE